MGKGTALKAVAQSRSQAQKMTPTATASTAAITISRVLQDLRPPNDQGVRESLEIVIAAVLAVAVGVIFWAWDQLWATAFSAVPFPISYLLVGIWMVGGLLVPYVV